jgi:hypothetical protein
MPTYVCDNCEDTEEMPIEYSDKHLHCECGGHMYLKLYNHFEQITDKCERCKHNCTTLCQTCFDRIH